VDESQGLLVQQDKEDSDVTPMKSLSSLVKPHFIRSKVLENIANIGPQMGKALWNGEIALQLSLSLSLSLYVYIIYIYNIYIIYMCVYVCMYVYICI